MSDDRENAIVKAYSHRAEIYDETANLRSCWGSIADRAVRDIMLPERCSRVVEVGCGSGHALRRIVQRAEPAVEFIGIEPALGMRERAVESLAPFSNVRIEDGRFESLPIDTGTVDYLFSILAFHWTTDVEKSIAELARVLKAGGSMDLFFTGRDTGREFTALTTPIFRRYMGPLLLLQSAGLRQHLTLETADRLFRQRFAGERLEVHESMETHFDDIDGHWSWWVARAAGHFLKITPEKRQACDQDVRNAIASLGQNGRIPYTVHLLHVRLRG
jgi:ubiquinone/menaquinone biosynthesis C-methylase UbiE